MSAQRKSMYGALANAANRKARKKGFNFNIMVAGRSGLGKSTLVNSLFLHEHNQADLALNSTFTDPKEDKTVEVTVHQRILEEGGVKLDLRVIDCPGFGDSLDCTGDHEPIVQHIEQANREFYEVEMSANRKNIGAVDGRIHCCLYFIDPIGALKGLRDIDREAMLSLHKKVNLIPVIAKADSVTRDELADIKNRIRSDILDKGIHVFTPVVESDEEEDVTEGARELRNIWPFAVVGSNSFETIEGRVQRVRRYPWGVVEIENEQHSDFSKLRRLIVKTHMVDLKDTTEDIIYEDFRAQILRDGHKELDQREMQLQRNIEEETAAKREELGDIEAELLRREQEMEKQAKALEMKRKQFEEEKRMLEAKKTTEKARWLKRGKNTTCA